MSKVFAIGDIHGCSRTFRKLLLEKIAIKKSDKIYCIGDYIDRGPDSKGVIDLIIQLRNEGYQIHTLRGNHEQMMLDAYLDNKHLSLWMLNGAVETLISFGISNIHELPRNYLTFLKETKLFITTAEYIFVHAGLNFFVDDPFTDLDAMLWTREEYFDPLKIENKTVIHGHTPCSYEKIISPSDPGNINIDGGCVYKNKPGYGNLIAISLPSKEFLHVSNID